MREPNQVVNNQFGTIKLDIIRRTFLMVPAAKSLVSQPDPLGPTDLDHFQCYLVRRSAGEPRFQAIRGVAAVDQFGSHGLDLLRPRYLCAPANKNNENPGAEGHPQALLCYKAKHRVRFGDRQPFIADQFLEKQVELTRRMEFCVPSSIGGILPTTTTVATTTAPPTTAAPTTTTSTTLPGSPSPAFVSN